MLGGVVALFFAWTLARDVARRNDVDPATSAWTSLAAPAVLASTASFQYWSTSAMEQSWFIALLLATLWLRSAYEDRVAWKIMLGVLLLTRPESMLVAVILLAERRSLRDALIPVLTFVGLEAWRFLTYGAWLPNTFAAKTSDTMTQLATGLTYVQNWLIGDFVISAPLIILLAALVFTLRTRERFTVLLMALSLTWIAAVIWLGGDVLHHERFVLPILGVLAALVGGLFVGGLFVGGRWTVDSGQWTVVGGQLLCWCLVFGLSVFDHRTSIQRTRELERELVSKMERTGTWLRGYAVQKYGDSAPNELVIAATTIGALKWASNATVIDMLGLTDRTIATRPRLIPEVSEDPTVTWKERKYNADYVLERAPEFIVFSTGLKPSAFAERALHAREFYVQYYPYYYDLPESKDMQIMFRRKPEQVLRRSPQQVVGLTSDQILALRSYPEVIMESRKAAQQDATKVQRLIANGPRNFSMPYVLLGDIYLAQQQYDSAAVNYTRAISIDPCMIRGHYQLLQFAMAQNDTAAASLHLDWVRRCNPRLLSTLGMQVPPNVY
jgi:hypothetical protein